MYRINVYPEREERGRRQRRGLLGAVVLGLVVGVEVLLLGLLGVSGHLIGESNARLESEIAALRADIPVPEDSPPLRVARDLVRERNMRIDWSPLLASVAAEIPDDVVLTEIAGGRKHVNGVRPGFDIEGRVSNERHLESVVAFVDSLRGNERITGLFPLVDLETIETERTKSFRIVARRPEGTTQ